MRWTIRKKILFGYGLSWLAVIIIGLFAYLTISQFTAYLNRSEQASAVRSNLDALLTNLATIEAAHRGYLYTGEATDYETYKNTLPHLDENLAKIRGQTALNDPHGLLQENQLERLEGLIDQHVTLLEASIKVQQTQGTQIALMSFPAQTDAVLLLQIYSLITEMHQAEKDLMTQTEAQMQVSMRSDLTLVIIGTLLILSLTTVNGLSFAHYLTQTTLALLIGAKQLANGDFHVRVQPTSQDEIAELSVAFNQMAEHLQATRAELVNSQALFQSLFEAVPDAILAVNPAGKVVFANIQVEELFGYTSQEIVGLSVEKLMPEGYRERHQQTRTHYMKRPQTRPMGRELDLIARHRLGHEFPVDILLGVAQVNETPLVLAVVRDITLRKQAQIALHEINEALEQRVQARTAALTRSEQEYRALADNALVGVFRTRKNGENLYANEAMAQILEYPSIALSLQHSALAHFKDPREQTILLQKAYQQGKIVNYELELLTHLGNVRTVLVSMTFEEDIFSGMMIDITARKQAERALQESLENMAVAQRIGHLGSWEIQLTEDLEFIDPQRWSDECYRILGFEPGSVPVTQAFFYSLVHLDDRQIIRETLQQAIRERKETWYSYRILRPDGELRYLEERINVIFDEDKNRVLKVIGLVHDITDRKQAEEALLEEKIRLTQIAATVPGLLYSIRRDVEGQLSFPYLSPKLEEMCGYLPERIEADLSPIIRRINQQDLVTTQADWQTSTEAGEPLHVEFRYDHPTKGERWIEALATPLPELDGGVVWHGFMSDVTARKKAEEEIRQLNLVLEERVETRTKEIGAKNLALQKEIMERAQLEAQIRLREAQAQTLSEISRALAEASLEQGLLYELITRQVVDAVGDTCYLGIYQKNSERLEIFALHQTGQQKPLLIVVPAELGGFFEESYLGQVAISGGSSHLPQVMEDDFNAFLPPKVRPQEQPNKMICALIVPVRARGRGMGVLGVSRDHKFSPYTSDEQRFLENLAERAGLALENARLLREAREARVEADQANRAKNEFLSRMSHELRTPLNAILGFGQLLLIEDLSKRQKEGVGYILRAGKHLLVLINEILDITRIEAGKMSFAPKAVRVSEILGEALNFVERMAAERQITLETGLLYSGYILADKQRLRQVLLNLLSNAIKYNYEGGKVIITCEVIPEARLYLGIQDTGPGISPEQQKLLFTPFERLGAERTSVEGTGLGLSLSRNLMEAMGGSLHVESELGRGSTFWLELKIVEDPSEESYYPDEKMYVFKPTDATQASKTVVYLEDNLSNLQLMEEVFKYRPFVELIVAMDGKTGLKAIRKKNPALILLDINLPDQSGNEILNQLKADDRLRHIPVVIISADATSGQTQYFLGAGAHAYFTKPLEIEKFLTFVDEIFETS